MKLLTRFHFTHLCRNKIFFLNFIGFLFLSILQHNLLWSKSQSRSLSHPLILSLDTKEQLVLGELRIQLKSPEKTFQNFASLNNSLKDQNRQYPLAPEFFLELTHPQFQMNLPLRSNCIAYLTDRCDVWAFYVPWKTLTRDIELLKSILTEQELSLGKDDGPTWSRWWYSNHHHNKLQLRAFFQKSDSYHQEIYARVDKFSKHHSSRSKIDYFPAWGFYETEQNNTNLLLDSHSFPSWNTPAWIPGS